MPLNISFCQRYLACFSIILSEWVNNSAISSEVALDLLKRHCSKLALNKFYFRQMVLFYFLFILVQLGFSLVIANKCINIREQQCCQCICIFCIGRRDFATALFNFFLFVCLLWVWLFCFLFLFFLETLSRRKSRHRIIF